MALGEAAEIFISYSHKDERYVDELKTHLALLRRQGLVAIWHDRQITAGSEWKGAIDFHLESARIILLLISPDFLASDYCYDVELRRALERHERREAKIVPVFIRPCDWKTAPFAKIQGLPQNSLPIAEWRNADEGWVDVVTGLRKLVIR